MNHFPGKFHNIAFCLLPRPAAAPSGSGGSGSGTSAQASASYATITQRSESPFAGQDTAWLRPFLNWPLVLRESGCYAGT